MQVQDASWPKQELRICHVFSSTDLQLKTLYLDLAKLPKPFQIHTLSSYGCVHSVGWAPHGFLTQFNKPSIKGRDLEEGELIGCRGISGHFNWYPLKIHKKDFKLRRKLTAKKSGQINNAMIEILHIVSYLITQLCHVRQLGFFSHCSAKHSPFLSLLSIPLPHCKLTKNKIKLAVLWTPLLCRTFYPNLKSHRWGN